MNDNMNKTKTNNENESKRESKNIMRIKAIVKQIKNLSKNQRERESNRMRGVGLKVEQEKQWD